MNELSMNRKLNEHFCQLCNFLLNKQRTSGWWFCQIILQASDRICRLLYWAGARDHDLREHIPVPYDNLFQSILSSRHAVKVIFTLGPMVALVMANGH